ncbi:MAG TPA: cupin domain-containing protein [Solirubrobacteraceae bacterium]|nr:cupin domain-containing protein [Solirubrobacteraceae bacterium]
MAHAGQSIANPVTGERVVFRSTAADSGGALLSMDYFAPAHHVIAPTHVHPRQEERSEVLAGRLHGHIGGDKRTVEVGEVAVVAPAVHHAWRSAGDGELHMLVDFRPALATETVLEVLWGLARAGRTNKRGMPSPLQMAVLMRDHLDETCAPVIPMVAQRALVGGMAAIGRRRGYRSVYPELLG